MRRMLAPMDRQNDNRAIRQNAKVNSIRETRQHASPGLAMSARKGQRARHDALNHRLDGTPELGPKPLASFFVPAPSLKDFILCFGSENNTSGHSLSNSFRRTSDHGIALSALFSWSAHRRSSSARCSGLNASSPSRSWSDRLSHSAIARSARSPGGSCNSCTSMLDSMARFSHAASAAASECVIVHEPTRAPYDVRQACIIRRISTSSCSCASSPAAHTGAQSLGEFHRYSSLRKGAAVSGERSNYVDRYDYSEK